MIDGLQIIPLRRIPDERGTVMHVLKATDPHFKEFGEVYASTIYRDVVKGWHLHYDMTLNYACVFGRIKLVVYDDQVGSPTRHNVEEIFLGPDNYSLVIVPPGLWNGFKGMDDLSIVINCATHPHDPTRSERIPPSDPLERIPYSWDVVNR